jgi:hypothetical protein
VDGGQEAGDSGWIDGTGWLVVAELATLPVLI